jgi:integrase/recombinase XerD
MHKRPRGRPRGSTDSAVPLSSDQIKRVLKTARSRPSADRAQLLLSLSIDLGMRATELGSLKWTDVYHLNGSVRSEISAKRAFCSNKRSHFDISAHPKLQRLLAGFYEKHGHPFLLERQMPLFPSQRGFMTATSIARYLTDIYRRAGIQSGTSRSGRRTMLVYAKKN